MGVKKFVKDLFHIAKLTRQYNIKLNEEIAAVKKQVKEEENKPKVLGFPSK